jgi:hypothetical protein
MTNKKIAPYLGSGFAKELAFRHWHDDDTASTGAGTKPRVYYLPAHDLHSDSSMPDWRIMVFMVSGGYEPELI